MDSLLALGTFLLAVPLSCSLGPERGSPPAAPGGLPPGAFDGSTRLRIVVGSQPLDLESPGEITWSTAEYPDADPQSPGGDAPGAETTEYRAAPGVRLRFWRQGPATRPLRGLVAVELSGELAAAGVIVEIDLEPDRFESSPVCGRLGAGVDPDVVLLTLGDRVSLLADALVDHRGGHSLRIGRAHESLSRSVIDRGWRLRVSVEEPGETVLLEWEYDRFEPVPGGGRARLADDGLELGGCGFFPADDPPTEKTVLDLARQLRLLHVPRGLQTIELGRRWTEAIDDAVAFPEGLAPVVSTLRVLGLRTGVWIAPFGLDKSDLGEGEEIVGAALIRDAEGKPIETSGPIAGADPIGEHLWDPTSPAGRESIRNTVSELLRENGPAISVLRLGELAGTFDLYEEHAPLLHLANSGATESLSRRELATRALTAALEAVRAAAGPDRLLAGDWDTPLAAAGHLDFARGRTARSDGGDLLRREARVTLRELPLHGLAWRSEGLLLELSEEEAPGTLRGPGAFQALLDLRAVTGRSVVIDHRSMTGRESKPLLERRWPRLERVVPPASIRVLDLDFDFDKERTEKLPRMWAVQVELDKRSSRRDVAIFNWSPFSAEHVVVSLERLGAPLPGRHLAFDGHDERVLGVVTAGFDLYLPPRSSRVVSLLPYPERPTVLGNSAQLIDDGRLVRAETWNESSRTLECALRLDGELAGGDSASGRSLKVHVVVPPGYRPVGVAAGEGIRTGFERAGLHQVVRIESTAPTAEIEFGLRYRSVTESAQPARPLEAPTPSAREDVATGGVWVEWRGVPAVVATQVAAYVVYRDGRALGETFDTRFLDLPSEPWQAGDRVRYTVGLRTISGERGMPGSESDVVIGAPVSMALEDVAPVLIEQPWGFPGKRMAADGRPLARGGVGVSVPSRLDYDLRGRFRRFRARAAIDRGADLWAHARFRVELDGRVLFESDELRYGDRAVEIDIDVSGGRRLSLRVIGGERGGRDAVAPLANWEAARFEP